RGGAGRLHRPRIVRGLLLRALWRVARAPLSLPLAHALLEGGALVRRHLREALPHAPPALLRIDVASTSVSLKPAAAAVLRGTVGLRARLSLRIARAVTSIRVLAGSRGAARAFGGDLCRCCRLTCRRGTRRLRRLTGLWRRGSR